MDNEKIGKFILELRKQKGMTQKELAEKVGVSDKTISKWECGNSIPDITYLEALCNSLDISVNELLSGERLTDESYSEKAEENIMALMKENKSNKKGIRWRIVLGAFLCCASILFLNVTCVGSSAIAVLTFFYDMPTIIVYTLLSVGAVLVSCPKSKSDKLRFLRKIAIPNGALISLIQFVLTLTRLDDFSALGPSIAISILVLIYSIVVYLVATILEEHCEKEIVD